MRMRSWRYTPQREREGEEGKTAYHRSLVPGSPTRQIRKRLPLEVTIDHITNDTRGLHLVGDINGG
jgi:hypothetical protein